MSKIGVGANSFPFFIPSFLRVRPLIVLEMPIFSVVVCGSMPLGCACVCAQNGIKLNENVSLSISANCVVCAHTHALFKIVRRLNVKSPMMNTNADDAVLSSASVNDLYLLVFFLRKLRMQVAHSSFCNHMMRSQYMCWVPTRSEWRTPSKYNERMRNNFSNIALNFT